MLFINFCFICCDIEKISLEVLENCVTKIKMCTVKSLLAHYVLFTKYF